MQFLAGCGTPGPRAHRQNAPVATGQAHSCTHGEEADSTAVDRAKRALAEKRGVPKVGKVFVSKFTRQRVGKAATQCLSNKERRNLSGIPLSSDFGRTSANQDDQKCDTPAVGPEY